MPRTPGTTRDRHRRSTRLRGFDYTTHGAYFVTIVTHDRRQLFGRVVADTVQLNTAGRVVAEEWRRSGELRSTSYVCQAVPSGPCRRTTRRILNVTRERIRLAP